MFTKDSIKQFLKPDWRKILLAVVFILSVYFYVGAYGVKIDTRVLLLPIKYETFGLPVVYYTCKTTYASDNPLPDCFISYSYLVIDVVFWYFISCLLISAWDKIRKKPVV